MILNALALGAKLVSFLRRFWPILPVVLVLTGCQTAPQQIRLLTYNIHHAEGTDGNFDLPRIAQIITNVQPDLVALQEVDQKTQRASGIDQPAELGRLTGMHAIFGQAMEYSGGGYGNAILSRWPVLDRITLALPAEPGHEPRSALAVKVQAGSGGPFLWFISTHLDHTSDPRNRLAQATRIVEHLANPADGLPVILAGDLNARPESEVMELVRGQWTDASAANPQMTIPAAAPRARIDYILYRPAENWRVVESRVLEEPIASDHRPLFVILEHNLPHRQQKAP